MVFHHSIKARMAKVVSKGARSFVLCMVGDARRLDSGGLQSFQDTLKFCFFSEGLGIVTMYRYL